MHTIRYPALALSTGFEIVSLPDQAVQILSYRSVPQQKLTFHMPRANAYVPIFLFEYSISPDFMFSSDVRTPPHIT
jgi:hypothetical protein